MASLALLVVCFFFGVIGRHTFSFAPHAPRVLNAWVLYVSVPALVLRVVHGAAFEPALFLAASMLWLDFAIAAFIAWVLWKKGLVARDVAGAVALCAGLSNTSFVGLPLLEALGGPSTTPTAALIDQLGSFLAFSVLAVPFAAFMSGARAGVGTVLRRVLRFPPFIALLVALALRGVEFSTATATVLTRLSDMLSPLALASIGFQLDLTSFRGNGRPVLIGLAFKLGVAPLIAFAILRAARPEFGVLEHITVAQAAMAPMVTAGVLATEHQLAPKVCAALIAAGVPLSFLTVWLWWSGLS